MTYGAMEWSEADHREMLAFLTGSYDDEAVAECVVAYIEDRWTVETACGGSA